MQATKEMGKLKKLLNEFKDFAMRGNVLDMAVGVVVGGAFKSIVDSLVNDIISPLIGIFFSADFSQVVLTVNGSPLAVGNFINAVINFLIVAATLFVVVKAANTAAGMRKKPEEAPAAPTTKVCPYCQSEIPIKATRCPHCTSQLEQ